MKTWYQSMTMGNIVATKREVFSQIIESLVVYHCIDIHWRKVVL